MNSAASTRRLTIVTGPTIRSSTAPLRLVAAGASVGIEVIEGLGHDVPEDQTVG